jgi:hypothetical protein
MPSLLRKMQGPGQEKAGGIEGEMYTSLEFIWLQM